MKKISLTLLSLLMLFMVLPSFGQSAASLLKGMDELMSAPKDKEANVKMILTDRSGKQKVREAIMKQKGQYKKLYKYTAPEKQVGIATLSLPEDIIWLYMPAFNKAVKVTLLSKSQAFTGTDFSYEDMSGSSYSERFTPRILESSDDSIYQLELMPKSMKSRYSKIIAYLDKTHLYPRKMEYFDKDKNYFKYATYKYKKQGKYWYAEEVIMKDIKKEHSTEIILTEIKFDQGLEDSEFTVENLKPAK
ncbi:outer membrane lipoprotein-sorting protein [Lutimonas zeaxanthinifaciens]|uniref:outer membrane lipoprotein-sorting protein n=1 Tax=Lutimonas zeaxanthinifaciens TaxID=3060215 RepID=UPI00265D53E4|nr:outer membrane lipoprotein-sorting protein [Lutimonas sp. YSD2104]WKK65642.1 outer membrane lipoprotein-sorting protein [Lutimonas sp. YSD2104]